MISTPTQLWQELLQKELFARTFLGCFSVISLILAVIAISLPNWTVETTNSENHGLFPSKCSTLMDESECGYLHASEISSVVTVMFSGVSSLAFFGRSSYLPRRSLMLALNGTTSQVVFGVLTLTFFYYYKTDYFEDDGVNQEYPDEFPGPLALRFCYFLWCVSCGLAFFVSCLGYSITYARRFSVTKDDVDLSVYSLIDSA